MYENIQNETTRLIRWFSENPSARNVLCHNCNDLNGKKCLDIIESLKEGAFYDMIFILLMNNSHDRIISEAVNRTITDIICSEWERIGNEKMYGIIKSNMLKEIHKQKA